MPSRRTPLFAALLSTALFGCGNALEPEEVDSSTAPISVDDIDPASFVPTDAEPWNFRVPVTAVQPFVEVTGATIKLSAPREKKWGREWTVSMVSGSQTTTVGTFQVFTVQKRLTAKLISSVDAVFYFGVAFSGTQARALDVNLTVAPIGKTTFYYPYDWSSTSPSGGTGSLCATVAGANGVDVANFVNQGLVIPGVKVDSNVFSHATFGLSTVVVNRSASGVTAKFYLQREVSRDSRDQIATGHRLLPGGSRALQVLGSDSVRDLERQKYGTPRVFDGIVTQLPVRAWGSEAASSYLTLAEYERVAATIAQGGVEHLVMRLNRPRADIAAAVSSKGVTPHFYQFLGVARARSVGGVTCYSLVIRGQTQCVDPSWLAHDALGRPLVPTNCTWAYLDLRRDDVRAALTDIAREAIENGYGGIFFDGTAMAPDGAGYVGGASPNATRSLFWGRVQLLREVKAAMTAVNPNATLGTLSSNALGYTEFQTIGNYVVEEFANWTSYPDNPLLRTVSYTQSGVDPIAARAMFVTSSLYLGAKGVNATQVRQAHSWLDAKTTLPVKPYIEVGDVDATYVDEWAQAMRNVAASFP